MPHFLARQSLIYCWPKHIRSNSIIVQKVVSFYKNSKSQNIVRFPSVVELRFLNRTNMKLLKIRDYNRLYPVIHYYFKHHKQESQMEVHDIRSLRTKQSNEESSLEYHESKELITLQATRSTPSLQRPLQLSSSSPTFSSCNHPASWASLP